MKYRFYGADSGIKKDGAIASPEELYDLLETIWCKKTCAPRMQKDWSIENKTLGQCSITSFLAQDIFGGEVYGVELPDGNFHCFNVVDGKAFDLTSEQFKEKLDYSKAIRQERSVHFAKQEKYERYLFLKEKLNEITEKKTAHR